MPSESALNSEAGVDPSSSDHLSSPSVLDATSSDVSSNATTPSPAGSTKGKSPSSSFVEAKTPRSRPVPYKSSSSSAKKFSLDLDEDLWDSGQEWILIFDNLLKHPGGKSRGCKCDMCVLEKSPGSLCSLHNDSGSSFLGGGGHGEARSRAGTLEDIYGT